MQRIRTASDVTKKRLLALYFNKISYLGIYLLALNLGILPKFSAKRVLSPLEHIFNKVNRGIIQKPSEVGT